MKKLTEAQAKTLNDAEQILKSVLKQPGETIMTSLHHGWSAIDVTFFDEGGTQHSWMKGECLADKVNEIKRLQGDAASNMEIARVRKIEALEKELERLKGEGQ